MLTGWLNLNEMDEYGNKSIPLQVYSDCNSLVETLEMVIPKSTEKRLRLDLQSMKENLDDGTISAFNHISTRIQVADALTKRMDVNTTMKMMKYFTDGQFPYYYDDGNDSQHCNETYTQKQLILQTLMENGGLKDVYGAYPGENSMD